MCSTNYTEKIPEGYPSGIFSAPYELASSPLERAQVLDDDRQTGDPTNQQAAPQNERRTNVWSLHSLGASFPKGCASIENYG